MAAESWRVRSDTERCPQPEGKSGVRTFLYKMTKTAATAEILSIYGNS